MHPPTSSAGLRRAFLDFFAARGHVVVPSAGVVPVDRSILFTVAGMVPFKPYFVGDEAPPWPRAASVQKCVRAGGKHNDLDDVGRTSRHLSFFEMLGNFSFGDYFKAEAIPWAWELYTEVLGLDPGRLWVTVHTSDDEAESIWREVVGVPAERIQRLGEPNFWRMAETGPCGPSSEIFWDMGPAFGPDGGPAHGGADRFVEIWNLVFMQFDAQPDGSLVPLPAPSVDTGAGLERNLAVLQGVDSLWDTDLFRPLVAAAEEVTGVRYGGFPGTDRDLSLRILAEHGRTMTVAVADGVVPSNEERGYVLRRVIRRAVRHAYLLGVEHVVTPALVDATVATLGDAYPELVRHHDKVRTIVRREEERFRTTLARGVELLEGILARGDVGGDDAFHLHDTLGFPLDLTREIAAERGRQVDVAGFGERMERQRARAREAAKAEGARGSAPLELYREVVEEHGTTEFTGRREYETAPACVLALVSGTERVARAGAGAAVDVVLDRTPFYAEAGGQVGDTGTIESADGTTCVRVLDTRYGLPGQLVVHRAEVVRGEVAEGDEVVARIDGGRRDRIRRNHTATHVLHWALREVLGPHVQQAGSFVGPDRLRFDFQHFEALTEDQIERVEALANAEVISDAPVRHYETTMEHAESIGAVAFFGDKYGDVVRVLEAGDRSVELCGGTHVHALGFIGPVKIVAEGSVGANLRRIEAVTGEAALERIRDEERRLRAAAAELRTAPEDLPERVRALVEEGRARDRELADLRARLARVDAERLAADPAHRTEVAGSVVVTATVADATADRLQLLARAALAAAGSGVVVLGGTADGTKAGIVVAVSRDLVARGVAAGEIAGPAARAVGGGTGRNPDLAVGGGPRVDGLAEALEQGRAGALAALGALAAPAG